MTAPDAPRCRECQSTNVDTVRSTIPEYAARRYLLCRDCGVVTEAEAIAAFCGKGER
jgi:transcription initiation factor TFIIIB Brf1 subunit/transcription initiation factor TFIIB